MIELDYINKIREKFPVTQNLIYFDHAAVAPIHIDSVNAVNEYLSDLIKYGDRHYKNWFNKSEEIRKGMAEFINADADEIAYIKNTSQGISIVANGLDFQSGDNVVLPDIEFPANVYPWMGLEKKGVKVKLVESINGQVPVERIAEAIDINTRVVSVSSVEFSSGYRNDLRSIGSLCISKSEEYGRKIFFNVDAIQSLGALKIDVKDLQIDFLSADGHKWFLTPEGAGIFYCNRKYLNYLFPSSLGWKSVKDPLCFTSINFELHESARKFEEGSLNMMGIVALGASLNLFNSVGMEKIERKILYLTRLALEALKKRGYIIIGSVADSHRSGIISFKAPGAIEDIYKHFIDNNIQLSLRGGNLRISPHFYNTEEEIAKFISLLR
ncbi:MAG: aminotransferase class V-fold PLP-dependent enzyme [Cyanobacteriota bacterium]